MEFFKEAKNFSDQNIDSNYYKEDSLKEKIYLEDILEIEDFCRKIEKDARRYNRYLGNDTKVVSI